MCTSAVRNCLECREKCKPKTPKLLRESAVDDRKAADHMQSLIGAVQPTPKVIFVVFPRRGGGEGGNGYGR